MLCRNIFLFKRKVIQDCRPTFGMTKYFLCPSHITWRYLVGSHLTVVVTAEDEWRDLSILCSIQSDKYRINISTCCFKIVAGTSVLYCVSSVTSDPNSDITRCFSTHLGRHTVLLDISVSARSVVYGPAPLPQNTPFVIECLFSTVTNSSYLCGLRFASWSCYFPLFYSVIPCVCFVSLKEATFAVTFISSYLSFHILTQNTSEIGNRY
jgi:hypothetical protein